MEELRRSAETGKTVTGGVYEYHRKEGMGITGEVYASHRKDARA